MAEGWGLPYRERTLNHSTPNSPGSLRSAPVCRYYARGACAYAGKCRFLHLDSSTRREEKRTVAHTSGRGENVEDLASKVTSPTTSTTLKERAVSGEKRFLGLDSCTRREDGAVHFSNTGKSENADDSAHKVDNPVTSSAPKAEAGRGERSCPSEDWVNAPEFYPSGESGLAKAPKTYAEAVSLPTSENVEGDKTLLLCPYNMQEEYCKYGLYCPFTHLVLCDICNFFCLDPSDETKRKKHISECIKKHEKDMEISFAIQRSKDKTCGICYEVIMEKAPWEQKFGILLNCNHCFCLTCIRKWRQAKHFNSKIIRGCPECRTSSDFVCPSFYWVEDREDKEKLILDYKDALSSKDCKYFLQGRGTCPFGNKCFYLHAYPDGRKADVGPPVGERRQNIDGEVELYHHIFLWDFLEDRDTRMPFLEEVDDTCDTSSDSDDSDDHEDWLDNGFFL